MKFKLLFFCSFSLLAGFTQLPLRSYGQSPGGISSGLTAWFKADAGVTVVGGAITTWANQVANPGLLSLTREGGASMVRSDIPRPFNFNTYIQFNNGCFHKSVSNTYEDVVKASAGSLFGAGTGASALVTVTSNFTSSPCGGNRCASGTGYSASEFGNTSTAWSAGGIRNPDYANIWGLRASTAGTPQQENTFNGFKRTGSCGSRRSGAYRFAIGSFIGYYYGTGRIAEVICHNRQLSPGEFSKVESYLAVKYGVTLGGNATPVDYQAANGTMVWNGNGTFQNRVTVIGRDDSSALHQKQSLSVHAGAVVSMYNGGNYAGAFPLMNMGNAIGFAANNSFMAFGDDQGDTLINRCSPDGRFARMSRTWKVQVTGSAGNVTLALPRAGVPPETRTLLVSADPSFTTGVTIIPLQDNGTERYAAYTFSNGQYFTFGSLPMTLNGIVSPPVCDKESDGYIILNPAGGVPPFSYSWSTSPVQITEDIGSLPPGVYTVRVTQGNGCTFDSTFILAANPPLSIHVVKVENTICTDDNGLIHVDGVGGTKPWEFSINGGAYGSSGLFSEQATGTHIISLIDRHGCQADSSIVIDNTTYGLAIEAVTKNAWCNAGGSDGAIELRVMTGTSPYRYSWESHPMATGPEINNLSKGSYTATVTDDHGCFGHVSVVIDEKPCCALHIPTAFSPNGDGMNDVFLPTIVQSLTNYEMSIFNRWGERIFLSDSAAKGWDGTINGKPCEAGSYFFHIVYYCEMDRKKAERRGDVTILR